MAGKFGFEVKVIKLNEASGKMVGIASITFSAGKEDVFCVSGIKVIEGSNGLFIGMPNRKTPDGEYKDICFPLSKEFRDELQAEIIETFQNL